MTLNLFNKGLAIDSVLLMSTWTASPGSLEAIGLSPAGQPRTLLHRESLELLGFRDPDGDGFAEIIGRPCRSQEFGNALPISDPLHVHRLARVSGGTAGLTPPPSKSYNLKHYGTTPVIYIFFDRIGPRITGHHISPAPMSGPSEPGLERA